jgi:hypothetical protein
MNLFIGYFNQRKDKSSFWEQLKRYRLNRTFLRSREFFKRYKFLLVHFYLPQNFGMFLNL